MKITKINLLTKTLFDKKIADLITRLIGGVGSYLSVNRIQKHSSTSFFERSGPELKQKVFRWGFSTFSE